MVLSVFFEECSLSPYAGPEAGAGFALFLPGETGMDKDAWHGAFSVEFLSDWYDNRNFPFYELEHLKSELRKHFIEVNYRE